MDAQLVGLLTQFPLLALAGLAYRWLYNQHRAERKERDGEWREWLGAQQKEFTATTERVVAEFRDFVTEEREVTLAELRRLSANVEALIQRKAS